MPHVEISQQSLGGDTRFYTQAIQACRRLTADCFRKLFHTLQHRLREFLPPLDGELKIGGEFVELAPQHNKSRIRTRVNF